MGQIFSIGDYNFEVVDISTYLGSMATASYSTTEEINRRVLLVNKNYFGLYK